MGRDPGQPVHPKWAAFHAHFATSGAEQPTKASQQGYEGGHRGEAPPGSRGSLQVWGSEKPGSLRGGGPATEGTGHGLKPGRMVTQDPVC